METFPQYKLEDFYRKHYYQGGIHLFQVQLMYEYIQKREIEKYEFHASLQGIDLRKEMKKHKSTKNSINRQKQLLDQQEKKQDMPLFRDPEEYKNLSQEERDELTKKMMGQHRQWVQGKQKIGGKK